MNTESILIMVAVFVATVAATFVANAIIRRKSIGKIDDEVFEDKIKRISNDALKSNTEQFLMMAKQVLGSEKTDIKNEIRADLEGKKTTIEKLIEEIRKDLKNNQDSLKLSEDERIKTFSSLKTELETYKQITGELRVSTDKLKELLSNNQMRGAFGEQVAENLLKMAGFVIGQDYNKNEALSTHNTRPDFTLFLPDKTKINIDVKFPYASLVKYTEAESKTDKENYLRAFKRDVKEKIKQVCTRDYINPEEKTVDFVILFIPNEMIFSFVYDKMNEIWEEATRKKVILAGPFSFTAILRMVKSAYTNFKYQENLHQIIGLIQKFDDEYQKYTLEVDTLGKRLQSTSEQFEKVSRTRDKALTGVVEKIRNQNIIADPVAEVEEIVG